MTKREHEALQKFFNTFDEHDKKADSLFKQLQERNAEIGTGTKWCSAEHNATDLLSTGDDYGMTLYTKYVEERGKAEAIMKLGRLLADLNFWKAG